MAQAFSATAEAGCLHDVFSRADRERIDTVLESLTGGLARNLGVPIAPEGPSHGRGPCTGAACSGMPGVPPSAPPGVYDARAELWACLPAWNRPAAIGRSPSPDGPDLVRPILLADPVFHPPRPPFLAA
jgi:hypothetical protein